MAKKDSDEVFALLEQLNRKMDDYEKRLHALESTPSSATTGKYLIKESPREFFLNYAPKKDTDKTLVAIHFLESKGIAQITAKEIATTLAEMREVVPENVADKIQLLDKRGFLIRDAAKREGLNCWNTSQSGKNYLEGLRNGDK